MGGQDPRDLTLDSGALIALEAFDRRVSALIQRAKDNGRGIVIPAGVLAQVWRGEGPRQARIARLIKDRRVTVEDLTRARAKAIGEVCARTGSADVVDASVVLAAWANGGVVITSDRDDIAGIDPSLTIIDV